MNAMDLLIQQHDDVDELIAEIQESDDEDEREALFTDLGDKLAAHAKIEETIFYPAVMRRQTEEILLESVEEHLSVKRLLADLLELDTADPQFAAKLAVMKEQLDHHARIEEEGELFPKVRELLGEDELDALGAEMAARFDELLDEEPRLSVPDETDEAAPLH